MSDDGAPAAKEEDVVLVHAAADSGDGYKVVRKRGERIELGEIRAAREGRPIHGELVRLKPREEHDRLFDVEVLLPREGAAETKETAKNGPAQVASPAYRAGWDAVFGRRAAPRRPN